MLNRLANLAGSHPKRVLIFAGIFFLLAGALGSGVADRLDPYGADDPDKEAFIAKQELRARATATLRRSSSSRAPTPPPPRALIASPRSEAGDRGRGRPRRLGLRRDKSDAFVSKDGQSTYLAVQFEATEDDALQDTGEALVAEFEGATTSWSGATRSPNSRSTRTSSPTFSAPSYWPSRSSSSSHSSSSEASSPPRCRSSSAAWRSSRPSCS